MSSERDPWPLESGLLFLGSTREGHVLHRRYACPSTVRTHPSLPYRRISANRVRCSLWCILWAVRFQVRHVHSITGHALEWDQRWKYACVQDDSSRLDLPTLGRPTMATLGSDIPSL